MCAAAAGDIKYRQQVKHFRKSIIMTPRVHTSCQRTQARVQLNFEWRRILFHTETCSNCNKCVCINNASKGERMFLLIGTSIALAALTSTPATHKTRSAILGGGAANDANISMFVSWYQANFDIGDAHFVPSGQLTLRARWDRSCQEHK